MAHGPDDFDALAHALVEAEFDFDAVERGDLRAEWAADDAEVDVVDRETGESVSYSAEDLVRATSEREVTNARQPETE